MAADIGQVKVAKGDVQIQRGARQAGRQGRHGHPGDRRGRDRRRRLRGHHLHRQQPRFRRPEQRVRDRQVHASTPPPTPASSRATLRKGKLAAVSGKMVKQSPESMKIRTPSAVMGVRGTEFVVQVDEPRQPLAAASLEAPRGPRPRGPARRLRCARRRRPSLPSSSSSSRRTDGHVGSIVVNRGGESRVIDTAYGAQRIRVDGASWRAKLTRSRGARHLRLHASTRFPARPPRFMLYFLEGKDELTGRIEGELDKVFAELKRRPLPDIVVIGHTDTVGGLAYNDKLSLARAERLREMLVGLGIAGERIERRGPRQARAARAHRRQRLRSAQPPRRDQRPLAVRVRPYSRSDCALTPLSRPCQRSASSVRSSAGSAPSAKRRTSSRSAADQLLGRRVLGHPAERGAQALDAEELALRVHRLGRAVGHHAQPFARHERGASTSGYW